jgi:hypothetical protein
MIRPRSHVALLLAGVLLLGLAFAPRAAGSIYWANDKGTTIGTANAVSCPQFGLTSGVGRTVRRTVWVIRCAPESLT